MYIWFRFIREWMINQWSILQPRRYKKILQPQLTYIDTFVRSVQTVCSNSCSQFAHLPVFGVQQQAFVQLYSQELNQRLWVAMIRVPFHPDSDHIRTKTVYDYRTQFPFTDTFFKELNAAETSSGFLGRKKTKMRVSHVRAKRLCAMLSKDM